MDLSIPNREEGGGKSVSEVHMKPYVEAIKPDAGESCVLTARALGHRLLCDVRHHLGEKMWMEMWMSMVFVCPCVWMHVWMHVDACVNKH